MSFLNKWLGLGNLTADPQREELSGNPVATFTMAINEPFRNVEGEKRKAVTFVHVVAFGPLGDEVMTHLKKSRQVLVEGRLDIMQVKVGEERYQKVRIWANNIQFLGSNKPEPEVGPLEQTR